MRGEESSGIGRSGEGAGTGCSGTGAGIDRACHALTHTRNALNGHRPLDWVWLWQQKAESAATMPCTEPSRKGGWVGGSVGGRSLSGAAQALVPPVPAHRPKYPDDSVGNRKGSYVRLWAAEAECPQDSSTAIGGMCGWRRATQTRDFHIDSSKRSEPPSRRTPSTDWLCPASGRVGLGSC